MAARRRPPGQPVGAVAVSLPGAARVRRLHSALAAATGASVDLDLARVEQALAHAFDASTLGAADRCGPAVLVMLGFRDQRPAGPLDPALGFLTALAILDGNGIALDDVPYAEVAARLAGLGHPRPQQGEAEDLHRWLLAATRPAEPMTAPLPASELGRLLEAAGFLCSASAGRLQVSRPKATGSRLPVWIRRPAWEVVHELADPGEGLVGTAAIRALRAACGLPAPFLDDAAWTAGTVLHHRHLWPRLLGAWN